MDFDKLMSAYEGARSSNNNNRSYQGGEQKRYRAAHIPIVREAPRRLESTPRVLVIVCAGPNSLHHEWFKAEDLEEGVTLGVVWYGANEPDEKHVKHTDKILRKAGPKWQLIRAALKDLYPDWQREFDYVWMPDDDLRFVEGRVTTLARVMAEFELDLAQPCLVDKNITCAAYRPIVLRSENSRAVFHRTNFVEIMCPMLSTAALQKAFPTFDDDTCRCGWGLDSVWPTMLHPRGVAVIDVVMIEHTRPPSAFATSTEGAALYSDMDPRREELNLLAKYRVAPYVKKVFEIIEV